MTYEIYDGNNEGMIGGYGPSYYGGYRTRTFADVFPSEEDFTENFTESPLNTVEVQELLPTLYYLLYARYGNSHSVYSDENQFVFGIFSTIWQWGPAWAKELEIQKAVRAATKERDENGNPIFQLSGKEIYNHSYNPSTEPSNSTLEELQTINSQNTSNKKKSPMEGYATVLALLEKDVSESFLDKFKKHFIKMIAPDYPLLYTTEAN